MATERMASTPHRTSLICSSEEPGYDNAKLAEMYETTLSVVEAFVTAPEAQGA